VQQERPQTKAAPSDGLMNKLAQCNQRKRTGTADVNLTPQA